MVQRQGKEQGLPGLRLGPKLAAALILYALLLLPASLARRTGERKGPGLRGMQVIGTHLQLTSGPRASGMLEHIFWMYKQERAYRATGRVHKPA